MNSDLLQGFYLGALLVEPLKGQVTGKAGTEHLPPKAVEVLLCLASEPGELVTREHLLNDAWGVGLGSQEALSHAISEIRRALGDHHDDPVFLQTLPKRGYRLLVDPATEGINTSTLIPGAKHTAGLTEITLIENLKQRGVLETVIAYLVTAWLLIQVADIVFDQLHFPAWAGTFLTVLVIAGFPITILLSWFLEFRDGRAIVHELSPADARKRRFSRTYISVVVSLGIAGIAVYVYDTSIGLPQAPDITLIELAKRPPIVQNSFAVLPFLNLDGSDETSVFANGLVDDVITRLSRVPGLRVSSRGDSFTLAPNSSSQKVRERLRVEMYLEGSVEIAGDKIRVTVQLIDSETGFHVSSRSFDRPREGFFEIRDEITNLTVASVRVALPPDTRSATLRDGAPATLDVYKLYRRGVEASRLPLSIDNINVALKWYDSALAVDAGYAAAYAGKCELYVAGFAEVDDQAYIVQAESACGTALDLNPNLDVVHTSLGRLYAATGRYEDAEVSFRRALRIDGSSVASFIGLGDVYRLLNRHDEAEANLRMAIGLHPGDPIPYNRLGVFLFRSGRYDEAAEQYQYVVALQPTNMNAYANLGAAFMQIGRFDLAAPAYQKAIEIDPTKNAYSNLGLMYYYLGDLDAAITSHSKAVELNPNDHLARSNLGDALWIAGHEALAHQEFRAAEAMAESALQINRNDPFIMMDLSWIYAMLAKQKEARKAINRALELAPDDPYSHYYNGLVHLQAGDADAALAALKIAAEMGYSRLLMAAEPHLALLKNDVRFSNIVDAL
ncbi:MAG: tetratricopeptide repeat protein [Gammaproteobacteria bacterium]|nr:tetratricopeptide repeat protein [Gammaproteobacteria bacterium]